MINTNVKENGRVIVAVPRIRDKKRKNKKKGKNCAKETGEKVM